jgi:hypothetical protein
MPPGPPNPFWVAHLACGHQNGAQARPAVGGYLSCLTRGCWRNERIVSVSPVLAAVPGPMVQGELFTAAEIRRAA